MTTKSKRLMTIETYPVSWDAGSGDIVLYARLAVNEDGSFQRWNGFVCPFFPRSEINRYIAWASDEPTGDFERASWDGDTLVLTNPAYATTDPDYEPDRIEPTDGYYAMGAWAWTWSVVNVINGCPVIYENGPASVIEHPAGFMVYAGSRIGTYKTLKAAVRRADAIAEAA